MARIRSVKPEFWTDEALAECSPIARLLFVGTWTFADDKGNLDRSARQLKAQVFPYDALDCEPLILELIAQRLLVEYDAEGKKFLHIRNFDKHQKVDRESKPRFPLYDDSKTTRRVLVESSESPRPSSLVSCSGSRRESRGREGSGEGAAEPPAPAALVLHGSLPKAEWAEWIARRRRKRWPLDEVTLRKQLEILAAYDTPTQQRMLNDSIQAGWQGVFPPKGSHLNGASKPITRLRTAEEIEAEEKTRAAS